MGWNIGSTAFFVAAVIIVWSSIFGLYKSEEKQTGVTWIVMLLILLNCYHTFWAAVFDLVHFEKRLNGVIYRFLTRSGYDRYDPARFLDYKLWC